MRARLFVRLVLGGALFTCSAVALADNAVTTDPASLRAGPDDSYPEVAAIDAGAPIQVMGCLDDWSWCDVAFDGSRGWLYSPDISYEYQGGYVPFYSYAPALGIAVVPFSIDVYWGHYYHDRPWYGQRVQWEHRSINHRIPPGPRPSHSPPPHEVVRADRPHPGGGSSVRLGSAESPRPEADRPGTAGHVDQRPPDAHPPQHAAPPPPKPNMRPAEHPDTPRPDEHRAPAERAKTPPPAKEDHDDHPH
jgi:uncharacterized protein YraI